MLSDKHTEAAKSEMFTLGKQLEESDLDVEGACNILSMLARMPSETARGARAKEWVEALTWRFSGNKAAGQLLIAASDKLMEQHDQVLAVMAQAQAAVQNALTYALAGERRHTVVELINLAKKWRNAKWAEMAGHALDRHKAHIADADADALAAMVKDLKAEFTGQPSKLPLGNEDGRQSGGPCHCGFRSLRPRSNRARPWPDSGLVLDAVHVVAFATAWQVFGDQAVHVCGKAWERVIEVASELQEVHDLLVESLTRDQQWDARWVGRQQSGRDAAFQLVNVHALGLTAGNAGVSI